MTYIRICMSCCNRGQGTVCKICGGTLIYIDPGHDNKEPTL